MVALELIVLFGLAGYFLASRVRTPGIALTMPALLGVAYVAIRLWEGPRLWYSHAPLWLWVLAFADLYLPPLAALFGAALWQHITIRRVTRRLTR